jgi:hypothetical protein
MTDDPIDTIGPLALAVLEGSCPIEVLRDAVTETGWRLLPAVRSSIGSAFAPGPSFRPSRRQVVLQAIVACWRREQATAALRAAPPDGAGTCVHETPRPG